MPVVMELPAAEEPETSTPVPRTTATITLRGAGLEMSFETQRRGTGSRYVLEGATGFGLPQFGLQSDPLPDRHGSILRSLRYEETDIFLPILLTGTAATVRETRKRLEQLCDPLEGTVEIEVDQPATGFVRSRFGYYIEGLEGEHSNSSSGDSWLTLGLTFKALDPFWYGPETTARWATNPAVKPLLSPPLTPSPFLPVLLSQSTIGDLFEITNGGDAPAWPVIEVTGPGSDLRVTNTTTDKHVLLSGPIERPVTIDARLDVQDIYDAENTDGQLWDRVSLDSELFPIVQGANLLSVELVGATAATTATVGFRAPYRSGE